MTESAHRRVSRRTRRSLILSAAISVAAWVGCVAGVFALFVSASRAARAASADGLFLRSFLDIPVFTGFRVGENFGVHASWGVIVLALVLPLLITLTSSVVSLRHVARSVADA